MDWAKILPYITGTVDQELLLRNEYLAAENRSLRSKLRQRFNLTDGERKSLAEDAHRLGRKALEELAHVARPETIMGWYRRLMAKKFDGSEMRKLAGRPRIDPAVEALIVRFAKENPDWGYDRIVGALRNLGHVVSDQTVGNVLARHGVPTAPERKRTTRWREFIRRHLSVLSATDFVTVEVLRPFGRVTYYVLLFIHLESRRVTIAGITEHPDDKWMQQMARNATMDEWGCLNGSRYLLHDGDTKYTELFRAILRSSGVEPLRLPPRSPNLNAHVERWILSIKSECLSKLILFSEASLWHVIREYVEHYHAERNHQGKDNVLLFPKRRTPENPEGKIECHERLDGLLKYYESA